MARCLRGMKEDPADFAEPLKSFAFYGVEENREYVGAPRPEAWSRNAAIWHWRHGPPRWSVRKS